jgi:DNA repair protein SbcD/Mre11
VGCGHIHLHQFLAPHMAYAGNLEPFDISETGPKGYILGDLSQNSFTFVASSKRQYHQVDIVCDASDDHGVILDKIDALNLNDTSMVRNLFKRRNLRPS